MAGIWVPSGGKGTVGGRIRKKNNKLLETAWQISSEVPETDPLSDMKLFPSQNEARRPADTGSNCHRHICPGSLFRGTIERNSH